MTGIQDISWLDLTLGYLLLIAPIVVFRYYKTGMLKPTLIAVGRMTLQLFLVGLYLQFIFNLNKAWINIAWVLVMIVIASFDIIRRSGLNRKLFQIPVLLAITVSIIFIDLYFLGVVVKLDYLFDARYFIPITGMLIGNCLSINVMALTTLYKTLDRETVQYRFALANGATRGEALRPYISEALQRALTPLIATTAVVGLISLPGMMTGQILGGSDPTVAIKYQIMIMISVLVTSLLSVILAMVISNHFVFDETDLPKRRLVKR
ncbi:MAG: ABC transporter permease [Draconibacterium sp.]|nr:MAG: ABC transporter permease [Draconibacterium sp.]